MNVEIAYIGGSSTLGIGFPEKFLPPDVKFIKEETFTTPYGQSPKIYFLEIGTKKVVHVKMHGWRPGVSRRDASLQVFWVFQQLGVNKIFSEGGVGAVNHLLELRDYVIPTDYLDFTMRKDVHLTSNYLLIMRKPTCPEINRALFESAKTHAKGRVFQRGIYACTDGRHFESVAEVAFLKNAGADVIGQSMVPEVYLAREIGACYGRIDLVVNYAEGIIKEWEHEELKDIYYNDALTNLQIVTEAILNFNPQNTCECQDFRKETLLKLE
ncbi:MTAP family purine nucleoside phosphorylase [Carboxydothermus ferrireducens]|uniref:5'-methylthioadenosine phosphorylase n=1 Tax=Carboxydothermus ferrireducens DSM 11255 TaxID=1119529 RepID=A0ABX2RAN8_9THEO|nr:MTAP family purine nucleoside phosphorylase [Carboxydothermus ferrireducens]NYE58110.1 5'-methylthioadenosine phosphorylase [Carboxydothermus ferrireducens DSM 11255]